MLVTPLKDAWTRRRLIAEIRRRFDPEHWQADMDSDLYTDDPVALEKARAEANAKIDEERVNDTSDMGPWIVD